jgi:hypothetical protein
VALCRAALFQATNRRLQSHRSAAPANLRHYIRNFDSCASGFGPTIDFVFKATRTGLLFIVKAKHRIDYRHCVFMSDALKGVCYGAAQILRVIRFSF